MLSPKSGATSIAEFAPRLVDFGPIRLDSGPRLKVKPKLVQIRANFGRVRSCATHRRFRRIRGSCWWIRRSKSASKWPIPGQILTGVGRNVTPSLARFGAWTKLDRNQQSPTGVGQMPIRPGIRPDLSRVDRIWPELGKTRPGSQEVATPSFRHTSWAT